MQKESKTNSAILSLYSDEELRDMKYIDEIDSILKKYNILENDNELIQSIEKNTLQIINYISDLLSKDVEIPKDLVWLFENNYPFIKNVNSFLEKKLANLTNSDSTYFFKDISTMFNIFSISTEYKVFTSYDEYNFKDLSNLFRRIENELIALSNDKNEELFELKFTSYVILLQSLTQLCEINTTNKRRKKFTKIFTELMTESANILKYNTSLSEQKLEILNHILGTHLFYFIDRSQLKVEKKDLIKSIKSYYHALERLEDGYLLSKNSNFGGNENYKDEYQEFLIFKSNTAVLILDMLNKFENNNILLNEYKTLDCFKKLLKLFSDNFDFEINSSYELNSLEEFENKLLDSLLYNYKINDTFTRIINYNSILSDFIFSDKNFENKNLKTIYLILSYAKNVDDYKYLNIAQILSKSQRIKNDYHEFYKIKIFDLLIKHYIKKPTINYEIIEQLDTITEYINKNKIASHLFEAYSEVYLSLALLYSNNSATFKKAKDFYTLFIKTNGKEVIKENYEKLNEKILLNFSEHFVKELQINIDYNNKISLLEFSENMLNQHNTYNELEVKFEITKELTSISNRILNNPLLQFADIENDLVELIQDKIFGGLCKVYILGMEHLYEKLKDLGFKHYILGLDNTYAINLVYPVSLEHSFMNILDKNKSFLISNLNNITNTLKQNDKQLVDKTTELFNKTKLEETIKNQPENKLGFIEIYIESLTEINNKYGFEKGNEILKIIAQDIKKISKNEIGIYKLNGPKFGVLLTNKDNYEQLFDEIEDLVIKYENDYIKINPYIAYTEDKKEKILFNSSKNLDKAILNGIKKIVNI